MEIEEAFKTMASYVALGAEAAAVLIVAIGAAGAIAGTVGALFAPRTTHGRKKEVWRRFGMWLLLGLEFELAADIVRSVIAPTREEILELAAIAVIRTFLNYFLEKDIEHATEAERPAELAAPVAI